MVNFQPSTGSKIPICKVRVIQLHQLAVEFSDVHRFFSTRLRGDKSDLLLSKQRICDWLFDQNVIDNNTYLRPALTGSLQSDYTTLDNVIAFSEFIRTLPNDVRFTWRL